MPGIPSPWAQSYPRAVGLPPDGMLVPAGVQRVLLRRAGRLELVYTGFCLEPDLRHGARFTVEPVRRPLRAGDLALCDVGGWGDVRRILRREPDASLQVGLDAFPAGRERIRPEAVIGLLRVPREGLLRLPFSVRSRVAALRYWWRRIAAVPAFGNTAAGSVRGKYGGQVASYASMVGVPPGEEVRALVGRCVAPPGSLLVAGAGAGSEAIHFARSGYRIAGFDVLPEMIAAANSAAAAAGVSVEFLEADLGTLDLPGRRFDGAYITPLVYSFQQGAARRIECLRRLGRHLAPGGCVIYSAHLLRGAVRRLELLGAWCLRGLRDGDAGEYGDWYTWFLTPAGRIGTSFTCLLTPARVMREARDAGFARIEFDPATAHFVGRDFRL